MKVAVRWHEGTAEVEGLPCGVPGLAVTNSVTPGAGFHVIHVRSGASVIFFPDADPETALAAAQELGALADWSVSGTQLREAEELALSVVRIAQRRGGELTEPAASRHRGADPADLAGASS